MEEVKQLGQGFYIGEDGNMYNSEGKMVMQLKEINNNGKHYR